MMDREWRAILDRYGQAVTVYEKSGGPGVHIRAFLQPVLEKGEAQTAPSPLGMRREDRFLYLGPADVPLTARKSLVECREQRYEVQSAHPVGARTVNHWWAVLRPQDKEGL